MEFAFNKVSLEHFWEFVFNKVSLEYFLEFVFSKVIPWTQNTSFRFFCNISYCWYHCWFSTRCRTSYYTRIYHPWKTTTWTGHIWRWLIIPFCLSLLIICKKNIIYIFELTNLLFSNDSIWTHTIDTLQHKSLSPMFSTLDHGVKGHFQQYFSYIVAVSFIGWGNRSTWRKQPTRCKSLTNFIT